MEPEVILELARTDLALGREVDVEALIDLAQDYVSDTRYMLRLEEQKKDWEESSRHYQARALALEEALRGLIDAYGRQHEFERLLNEAERLLEGGT